ncbi:MAG: VWA domain-containing protein [Candidatus Margulisbacteria bacterium]|jgi:Ca-activated chloride channel family protein|nr:VWA domain-containing protein [Candidatus Margulisiibacteriota bacterium]
MVAIPMAAWAFIIIPVFALLQWYRFKDRTALWSIFQSKARWAFSIRLSHYDTYIWQKLLMLLGVAFIIIALMRPQFGEHYQTVQREGRQLFFIMDTSLSMLAEDGATTRLDLARYHVQQLLPKLSDDFIGIIPYADTAYTYLPLTTDIGAVDLFLEDMFVGMIGSSGSNIMNALTVVKDTIKSNGLANNATLVIFSDGEFQPNIDQSAIITAFKGLNVSVIVVGVGSVQGEPIPIRNEANKVVSYKKDANQNIVISKRLDHQLERLAEAFNGWTVYGEVSPLVAEKIYLHLSKIETNELEQKQLITKIDRYHWFLFVALLLLMVAYALPRAQHVWNRQK